jgi:hypothetical protein
MEKKSRANRKDKQAKNEMQTRIKDQKKSETFTLTQDHIDFLRSARVVWDPSEAGAPIIDPEMLAESGLKRVHTALQIVLRFAQIQPGTYTIENQLLTRYDMDEIRADAEHNMIQIPQSEQITFELRPEHIKLLRNANADAFLYFGTCGLNSQRPYGAMTYWEIDAAHVLGMPVYRDQNGVPNFTEEELTKLRGLHHDMLIAVPVLLKHGQMNPAEYTRENAGWEQAV